MVELFILDTRQYRSLPTDEDTAENPKTMLGATQVPECVLFLPRLFAGHDPTRGSGQEVFEVSRGGSRRIRRFSYLTDQHGLS